MRTRSWSGSPDMVFAAPVQKLRADDDAFHQGLEAIPVGRPFFSQTVHGHVVRQLQVAPERIGQQLTDKIIDKILLPPLPKVGPQAGDAGALAAVGTAGAGFDGPAAQVLEPVLANGA